MSAAWRRRLSMVLAAAGVLALMGAAVGLRRLHDSQLAAQIAAGMPPVSAPDIPASPDPEPPTPDPTLTPCPQPAQRLIPTAPGPAVTARVDAAWARIESWLAGHAPRDATALGPPAAQSEIDAAQRQMAVAFPPDLVASLRRHNGVAEGGRFTLASFYTPMTVAGIVSDWKVNCSVFGEPGDADSWSPRFVSFAGAPDGGSLVSDQRTGSGHVGEFFAESGASFDSWPPSIGDLLSDVAAALESGRTYVGHRSAEGE
jgi:cell wall assembly regulator SMI1